MSWKVETGSEVLVIDNPGHSLPGALKGLELPARAIAQRPAVDEHHGGLWWVKLKPPFEGPEVQVHADQLSPGDGSCPECGMGPGSHHIHCQRAKREREVASGAEPAAHWTTAMMLWALINRTIDASGQGSLMVGKKEDGNWVVAAEYGREAEDSPMAGAAVYGAGETAREGIMQAGADVKLWVFDDSPEPVERQRRVLIMEGEHPAELNLDMVKGSCQLVADSDEVYAFAGDKAACLKHRDLDVIDDPFSIAIAMQRRQPELSLLDGIKRVRDLAPHEVKCTCSHGGEFDMTVHNEGCARRQLAHVLAAVEKDAK